MFYKQHRKEKEETLASSHRTIVKVEECMEYNPSLCILVLLKVDKSHIFKFWSYLEFKLENMFVNVLNAWSANSFVFVGFCFVLFVGEGGPG